MEYITLNTDGSLDFGAKMGEPKKAGWAYWISSDAGSFKSYGKYFMRPQDIFNFAKKVDPILYRIGEYGLFRVVGEYEQYYTGHWRRGLYSQSVLKSDLRKLTDREFEDFNNSFEVICGVKVPLTITKD